MNYRDRVDTAYTTDGVTCQSKGAPNMRYFYWFVHLSGANLLNANLSGAKLSGKIER